MNLKTFVSCGVAGTQRGSDLVDVIMVGLIIACWTFVSDEKTLCTDYTSDSIKRVRLGGVTLQPVERVL